jgi:hypothetical protein
MGDDDKAVSGGEIINEQVLSEQMLNWLITAGSTKGVDTDFDYLKRVLVERGCSLWASEAISCSVLQYGSISQFWRKIKDEPHSLDPIFSTGDLWGNLFGLKFLTDLILSEVSVRGVEWEQRVATLILSFVTLRESLVILAGRRDIPPPIRLMISDQSLIEAQRVLGQ